VCALLAIDPLPLLVSLDGAAPPTGEVRLPLRLVVGNAGAVHVVCGGRDAGAVGRVGAVLRFDCARGVLVRA